MLLDLPFQLLFRNFLCSLQLFLRKLGLSFLLSLYFLHRFLQFLFQGLNLLIASLCKLLLLES